MLPLNLAQIARLRSMMVTPGGVPTLGAIRTPQAPPMPSNGGFMPQATMPSNGGFTPAVPMPANGGFAPDAQLDALVRSPYMSGPNVPTSPFPEGTDFKGVAKKLQETIIEMDKNGKEDEAYELARSIPQLVKAAKEQALRFGATEEQAEDEAQTLIKPIQSINPENGRPMLTPVSPKYKDIHKLYEQAAYRESEILERSIGKGERKPFDKSTPVAKANVRYARLKAIAEEATARKARRSLETERAGADARKQLLERLNDPTTPSPEREMTAKELDDWILKKREEFKQY